MIQEDASIKKSDPLYLEVAYPDEGYTLAPSLRDADIMEAKAMFGEDVSIGNLLRASIEGSSQSIAVMGPGRVLHGLWGHGAIDEDEGSGYVWFVSTDALMRSHGGAITKISRRDIFPQLDKVYTRYGNFVHRRNSRHIKWLVSAGFEPNQSTLHPNKDFVFLERTA